MEAARRSWTDVAIAEYRAVVAFADVVRAMALARSPLDLLGMASDFLADECVHVELASRLAMELGGGAPRPGIELLRSARLATQPDPALTPLQRANEIVLVVSSIHEAFTGGTALGSRNVAAHPLTRGVYD